MALDEAMLISNKFNLSSNLYKYRIILIGNAGVGKTALIQMISNNSFLEEYTPTNDIS